MDRLDELTRDLLRTRPDEFVAARNRTVKELRTAGEREVAAQLATLRRPSVSDWALNVVAADEPAVVAAFAEAATAVAEVQTAAMEGRGGGGLRDAVKALRVASGELADRAAAAAADRKVVGSGSGVVDIGARLAELAPDGAAIAALVAGLLGSPRPPAASVFGAAPLDEVGERRARRAASGKKLASAKRGKSPAVSTEVAAAPTSVPAEPSAAERRQRAAVEGRHREAVAAVAAQQRRLRQAERTAKAAADAVTGAERKFAEAEERLSAARDELEASNVAIESLRQSLGDAEAAVAESAVELERFEH